MSIVKKNKNGGFKMLQTIKNVKQINSKGNEYVKMNDVLVDYFECSCMAEVQTEYQEKIQEVIEEATEICDEMCIYLEL